MTAMLEISKPLPSGTRAVNPQSLPGLTLTTALDLDVTDGCNLACGYCFKNLDRPNNMTLETAKDAIEWLIQASGASSEISINFMGGEPTLRFKLLKDIVSFGKRRARAAGKRASFSFTSNMTIWTDEIREWVDREGIGVLMSIDGHPDVQDSQRPAKSGKPMSETIARWAKSMLRTRPQADARMTLSPAGVDRLFDSCVYLWEEIGFQSVMMADAAYEGWTKEHLATYDRELGRVVEYLTADFAAGGERRVAIMPYYMRYLISPRGREVSIARKNYPCGAGYNYMMVDHTGTIWPCHRFDGAAEDAGMAEQFQLGNIYQPGFNTELSNAFRNFDHSVIYKPECKTCPVEPTCGGFCPAANLQHSAPEAKSMYKPHFVYCQLKWMLYKHSENLYARMRAIDADRTEHFITTHAPANPGDK